MNDSPIVRLVASPSTPILNRYGMTRDVTLIVRCQDNTTALIISVDDYTGIDEIPVEIRIDETPSFVRRFDVSTSREHIGLWTGAQAIPVIRLMEDARQIRFRYTLPGENPEVLTFSLQGFSGDLTELATRCNWTL